MEKSTKVLRFGERDIIWVRVKTKKQGFYRSSGKNSGMEGRWLPFDGVGSRGGLWFDKSKYCHNLKDGLLYRFGNELLLGISNELANLDIPVGEISKPWDINKFIDSPWDFKEWEDILKDMDKNGTLTKYYK